MHGDHMDPKLLLTVYYRCTPETPTDRIRECVDSFAELGVTPQALWELPNDKQTTLTNAFYQTETPYLLVVDGNNWVDPKAIYRALEYLELFTNDAFCAVRDSNAYIDGKRKDSRIPDRITANDIYIAENRTPRAAVYRVGMARMQLNRMADLRFVLFEWALRCVLANQNGFKILDNIGYFVRKTLDRRGIMPVDLEQGIHPYQTVQTLVDRQLITLDDKAKKVIGVR